MDKKYEELFSQIWGEDFKNIKGESATAKEMDMSVAYEKVIKLFATHIVSCMLPTEKEIEKMAEKEVGYDGELGLNEATVYEQQGFESGAKWICDLIRNYR
jgi:hypothetical protein